MGETAIVLLIVLAVAFVLVSRYLGGADLSAFDQGESAHWQKFRADPASDAERRAIAETLAEAFRDLKSLPRDRHLAWMRAHMDAMFADHPHTAEFRSVDAGGVPAEWVLAPGADGRRRTLYIHGGAYVMGSPLSHRVITERFSQITGGAVLAIDYRLMPEHRRAMGIEDCRMAYRWILTNGPAGPASADRLFVAGDSAGGNLTLSLIAWLRDQRLRLPDAAVALSPATDAALASPSLRANLTTDPMLGPLFGPMARFPRALLLWFGWLQNRISPSHPDMSPLRGDLGGLPPVLIHASESEMLLDDSVRYANKAVAAGSPVRLQTWDQMVHVWHIFHPRLVEADQAFTEIARFLSQ